MLAVTRCEVPSGQEDAFVAAARDVLDVLVGRPGFGRGRVGRAMDDQSQWVLSTEWESVGAYRRGLSAYDAKVALAPLMVFIVDEPSAYDVVLSVQASAEAPDR